jgi:hypothetical protein
MTFIFLPFTVSMATNVADTSCEKKVGFNYIFYRWIFILLTHWNNNRQVDMLLHMTTCQLVLKSHGTVQNSNTKIVESGEIHTCSPTYAWRLTFLAWNRHFMKSCLDSGSLKQQSRAAGRHVISLDYEPTILSTQSFFQNTNR